MKSAFQRIGAFLASLVEEPEGKQNGGGDYAVSPSEAASMTSGAGIPLPENDLGLLIVNRWESPVAEPAQWDSPWDH
jgi:hypothetical protein